MAYRFRNQNNYASVPYPSGSYPKATVKSGGCGVCSACNALDNLFNKTVYDVKTMAQFSRKNGGRVAYGTDMGTLLKALQKKLGTFTYTYHSRAGLANALIKHLKNGGTAVLSTNGGSYSLDGLFSSAGHLYCAVGCSGDYIHILDSGYYPGKYGIMGRSKFAVIKGNYISVHKKYVEQASHNGGWLLSRKTAKKTAPKKNKTEYLYCNTTLALKFRKAPSTSAEFADGANSGKSIIGYGDKVEVISKGTEWHKIKYRGKTGYASAKYFSAKKPNVKTVTIRADYYMRTGASTNANKICLLRKGTKVSLLVNGYWQKNGYTWSRIAYNGKTGYVALKF